MSKDKIKIIELNVYDEETGKVVDGIPCITVKDAIKIVEYVGENLTAYHDSQAISLSQFLFGKDGFMETMVDYQIQLTQ